MASIFTSQTPSAPNAVEPGGISLGTTFVPAVNGTVTGIRFYAPTTVTGTWSGALYQPTTDDDPEGSGLGTLLGSGALVSPPTPGAWNAIPLNAPVAVTAGVPYRAVYHNTEGRYVSTPSFGPFVSGGLVNGDLTAPANGVNSGGLGSLWNGTFRTGATIAYPSNSFGQGCYFADVVFEATPVADGAADFPLVITVTAVGEVPSLGQGSAALGLGLAVATAGESQAPRRIAPSEGSRLVYAVGAGLTRNLLARPNTAVTIYAGEGAPLLADIETLAGAPITGSTLTTDQWSQLPLFRMPAGADTVWAQVADGPRWPVYAREDDRLDLLESDVQQLQAQVADLPPDLTAEVAELQADVAEIDTDLTQVSGEVDSLSVAVDYLESDVTGLDGAVTALQAADVVLPAPNGVDDTAAINTTLAASAGRRVIGRPGATYLTSAPLVIYSGTSLDMTGCTVRLLPGSQCNLIHNRAVATVRRLLDVSMTSGSATLVSATGGFTVADVGKVIRVERAGSGGAKLVTTISTVINATTVTLATAASTTIATQYAAVGARDADITVVGGLWDRQANNSSPIPYQPEAHSLRFRHVDGLTVRDLEHTATAGKYAVAPGDCTRIKISGIRFLNTSSDGIHFNGPIDGAIVKDIQAVEMGDDVVSITAMDTFIPTVDCFGDVTDIAIEDVSYRVAKPGLFASAIKIVAGQNIGQTDNVVVENIRIRNVTGPITTQSLVFIGDDNPIGGSGGVFRNIIVENVTSLGGFARYTVLLHRGTMERIVVRGVRPHPGDLGAVSVDIPIDHLTVDDLEWKPANVSFVSGIVLAESANIGSLHIHGAKLDFTGASPAVVRVGATARIGELQISGTKLTTATAGNVINMTAGAVIEKVQIGNLITSGFAYPAGEYRGVTQVSIANLSATGVTAWLYGRGAAAAVTVIGATGISGDTPGAGVAADGPGYVAVVPPSGGTALTAAHDLLSTGEETIPRIVSTGNPQLTSGRLTLTYFTARRTETIGQVRTATRNVATATPTLCRIGIYLVAPSGDLTLIASTANDTTMWSATFSGYTRSLTASWVKQAGRRYAIGVLAVAATGPQLSGVFPVTAAEDAAAPRINGSVDSQTDLPASVSNASVNNNAGASVYVAVVP